MASHPSTGSCFLVALAFVLASWTCCASAYDWMPAPVYTEELPDGSIINMDPGFNLPLETPRIVGGRNVTNIAEAPFMVMIKIRNPQGYWVGLCAGTILNAQWVLTASHCLRDPPVSDVIILAGNVVNHCVEKVCHADKGAQFLHIDRIVYHPKSTYDPSFPIALTSYDVAMIRVKPALKLDGRKVAAIQLPSTDYPKDKKEQAAYGWGVTKWEWNPLLFMQSSVLKEATIQIRQQSECEQFLKDPIKAVFEPEIHFCAGGIGGKQPCLGDSGGPLVTQGPDRRILGVLNYGRDCGAKDDVSVYTNVFKVLPWIKKTMGSRRLKTWTGEIFERKQGGATHSGSGVFNNKPYHWSTFYNWKWE